jgi:hypothetical protein
MKNKDFLLKIKEELGKYSYIPGELYDDIVMVIVRGKPKNLVPLLVIERKREMFFKNTNNLLKKASKITGLSPTDIFERTDFHSNDIARGRFETAFAELRTIIFLDKMNFTDIIPLKANKNKKCSDFTAIKDCHKYAIEVSCDISKELKKEFKTNEITIKPLTYMDDLIQDYVSKAEKKKKQLDDTAKEKQCDKKIFVMVLNDKNILGFLTFDEYYYDENYDENYEILEKISSELKWGDGYYFAILTGLFSIVGDNVHDGDIIYPPIKL